MAAESRVSARDDALLLRVGQEGLVYREMLQLALAQWHADRESYRKLELRYARLLEDFRALQTEQKSID